jgi:hypothetical protein
VPKSSPEPAVTPRCSCARCAAHAAGERGPFTPADFVRLFGYANEPAPVEVPAELAALGIAVDVARERYEAAGRDWSTARRRVASAEAAQSRNTGMPSAAERQEMDDARAEEDAAKDEMEEAGAALERAQVAYNALARLLQDGATVAAYAADQAAQAAERDAARDRSRAASQRRGLRALKAKVSQVST